MLTNRFTLTLTPFERSWGLRFLLFQQAFLPLLLSLGLELAGISTGNAEFNILYLGISFLATILIFRELLKESFHNALCNPLAVLSAVVLGLAAYWSMDQLVSSLIYGFFPNFFNVNDAVILAEAQREFLLMFLCTVIFAPLSEELLFRGLLFTLFRQRSRLWAYLVSTLLFCSIHVSGYVGQYEFGVLALCFLQYVPAGIALAWSFEFSDSIYAPIAIHTIINLIATLSMR